MYWYLVTLFYALNGASFYTIIREMSKALRTQQSWEWYWAHNYYDLPRL